MPTKIEWCDETINPVVGCSKCSSGCENCYAEKFAARLAANPKTREKYAGVVDGNGRWTGQVKLDFGVFEKLPRKPKSIFLASMGDIFHESLEEPFSRNLFEQIDNYPHHQFLGLTKRGHAAYKRLERLFYSEGIPYNYWHGVTICNQKEADEYLISPPVTRNFLSMEPLLGPIKFNSFLLPSVRCVIVGGETGSGARPMHSDWVRSLWDQCRAAGVPFFFKGWGEWQPREWKYDGATHAVASDGRFQKIQHHPNSGERADKAPDDWQGIAKVGKKTAGRLLDGIEHNEKPW